MTANVPGLSAVGEKLEAPYHRIRHPFDRQLWLELKILIGTGAYGRVYLADDQFSRRYAVKQLPHSNAAVREIELHNLCNGHPNVVYMYGWHQDQHGYWAVFEYCPSGDLFHHITHADGIFSGDISKKEEIVKQGFLQICNGVAWCHSRGVFHRDLKPENVLVWLEKDPDTNVVYPVLKVADFGLATDKRYTKDFGCGSSFYMSPGKFYFSRVHSSIAQIN
jgi:serine/threonine protein kinase